MPKTSKIIFNDSLTLNLIVNVIKKIPGINHNELLNVAINKSHDVIDVTFTPFNYIYNIYDLAKEVQDNIYSKFVNAFDITKLEVNVTAVAGGG